MAMNSAEYVSLLVRREAMFRQCLDSKIQTLEVCLEGGFWEDAQEILTVKGRLAGYREAKVLLAKVEAQIK